MQLCPSHVTFFLWTCPSTCQSDHVRDCLEFYLNMTPVSQEYSCDLVDHLWMPFKIGKTFNLVMGDFYSPFKKSKEMGDNFGDKLHVLAHKVISINLAWRSEMYEALKTHFKNIYRTHILKQLNVISCSIALKLIIYAFPCQLYTYLQYAYKRKCFHVDPNDDNNPS